VITEPAGTGAHETLNAVLWMQQSAEYEASALQVYRIASLHLDEALLDPTWDALVNEAEATGPATADRPGVAVILDVDETVLDNSPYQARLVEADAAYSRETWNEWVREERARPVPGALSFTLKAAEAGVTVFYVTNRTADLEEATRKNLLAQGFPVSEVEDVVLTRGERSDWTGDKSSRRAFIAERYRVLLLIGDDLNDFVQADDLSPRGREMRVNQYDAVWGSKWFVLPNPAYGSWERAVTREAGAQGREEQVQAKSKALQRR
jgi:acid phosphatase